MDKVYTKLAAGFDLGQLGTITLPGTNITGAENLVTTVITWLLGLAGALAVVAIVYSGIMYMMAGGDAEKATTARKNLLWAILGVIIIVLSYSVVAFINQLLFTNP